MSALAPVLQGYFTDRLIRQRRASPHTIAAYRDSFRLLLGFAQERLGKAPSQLELSDLDADLIAAFLEQLETVRGNTVTTRNGRLAAVHSLFRYAALRCPEDAATIQRVLAIPHKRADSALIDFLTQAEIDALLAAPDRSTWAGRRDHTLILVDVQTGLRVAELSGLRWEDIELGTPSYVRVQGKGRKERVTPLPAQSRAALQVWRREHRGEPTDVVFPSRRRTRLSHDAIGRLVAKHAAIAERHCPSLRAKNVTPHVLRHSLAMSLHTNGIDIAVIALILGHESIETTKRIYLHADLTLKERALSRLAPMTAPPGRYKPPDALLAFLESL
jgi:integrase/recombinase XerD